MAIAISSRQSENVNILEFVVIIKLGGISLALSTDMVILNDSCDITLKTNLKKEY
jgi:hypothetical protein